MKVAVATALCVLAALNVPTSAVLRARGGRSKPEAAPEWLVRIAEAAKRRAAVGAASADVLALESSAPVVVGLAAVDGTSPMSAGQEDNFASSSQNLRSSGGDVAPDTSSGSSQDALESLLRRPSTAPLGEKKVVWVTAYPRSGSSSILAMISPPKRTEWKTFTVFEPCVGRGSPWKKLMKEGCPSEVRRVTQCEYSGVDHIGAKESFDSFVLYDADLVNAPSLSGSKAAAACSASDVLAFKTITYGHDLNEVAEMLQQDERLRVLDVVRDPRGIYASWLTTDPFRGLVTGEHKPYWRRHDLGWFSNLTGICDQFQKNLHNPHPRVRRILFENLIKDPETTAKKNYEWLGLPFDDAAKSWLEANFDGDCSKETPFSTCRGNSSASVEKWREILPRAQQEAFTAHAACREIATFYGYPLE